ncbi:T9SS type A sorting domain-containing protein [Pedobacter sp. BS3]|uniref:T9SS type A sorting domain-containing protein n=1 Tax=Pedobacter sp. BS3 TaxID=2567937 RepID=UPI0011EF3E42|nr:T9SS type A sorting domain-containing protein [Pedobacter sp. BS3]TZF84592.1 T9SS type A sorting domain-containing protein [Pedobacter sp. BS3]
MAQLSWETMSEQNNHHFEILRASANQDFTKIKTVIGHGTSNSRNTYSITDFYPLAGTNYYKLVQVDDNGSATAAKDIVALTFGEQPGRLKVYAPDNSQIDILYHAQTTEKATIQLTDISGRKLYLREVNITKGDNTITIPVVLSNGVYVATLVTHIIKSSVKFLK